MGEPSKKYLVIYLVAVVILAIVTLVVYYYFFYRPIEATTEKVERTAFNVNATAESVCDVIIANRNTSGPFGIRVVPPSVVSRCEEVLRVQ